MPTILPLAETQFTDINGVPLALGTVAFYVPGTLTPKDTWQDSAASQLNINPVDLDSGGRAIIWGIGTYRQIVKDRLGNTIWDQITSDGSPTEITTLVINLNALAETMGLPIDGSTDNTIVLAAAMVQQQTSGLPIFWTGTLVTSATVYAPALSQPGANDFIGGGIKFCCPGRDISQWFYKGIGYALDDLQISTNNPGVRSGCNISGFRLYGSIGPTYSQATGGIRICNWREGEISDCQFDSFRLGAGVTLYGMPNGDMQYVVVRNCQFGWWSLNGTLTPPAGASPPRLGLDDFWWCRYGIVYQGNADGNGKSNENGETWNNYYNCWDADVWMTGYSTMNNPGVPFPNQSGDLGGSIFNWSGPGSHYTDSRRLWQGVAASSGNNGDGTCFLVLGSSAQAATAGVKYIEYTIGSATTNYYVDPTGLNLLKASVQTGVAIGLNGPITAYDGGTRTVTMQGQWPAGGGPALGDTVVLGYMDIGFDIDSAGGYFQQGAKTEQVSIPIRIRGVTSMGIGVLAGNIRLDPRPIVNSGGNGVVVESSQGPFTAQGGTDSGGVAKIQGPSTAGWPGTVGAMCPLAGWYDSRDRGGQIAQITSGTGTGQVFRVKSYSGNTLTAGTSWIITITAASWLYTAYSGTTPTGVTPDNTSVFQFIAGAFPQIQSPQVRVQDISPDSTVITGGSNIALDTITYVSRSFNGTLGQPSLANPTGPWRVGINTSGGMLTAGQVVRGAAGIDAYTTTTANDQAACVVVAGQFGTETYPPGAEFPYPIAGAAAYVKTSDLTPVHGDLITSTSAGASHTNNSATLANILGIALENALNKTNWGNCVLIRIK